MRAPRVLLVLTMVLALASAATTPDHKLDWLVRSTRLWPGRPPKATIDGPGGDDDEEATHLPPTVGPPSSAPSTPPTSPPQTTPPPEPLTTPPSEPPKSSPLAEVKTTLTTPSPPTTPPPQLVLSSTPIVLPQPPPLVPNPSPTSAPIVNEGQPPTPSGNNNSNINSNGGNPPVRPPSVAAPSITSNASFTTTTDENTANTGPATKTNSSDTALDADNLSKPTSPSQSKPVINDSNELDEPSSNKSQRGKLSGGAIGGIVVGLLLAIAAAILAFIWSRNRRIRRLYHANDFEEFKGFSPDSHTNLITATTIAGYGGDSARPYSVRDSRGYPSSDMSEFDGPAVPPNARVANGSSNRIRSDLSFRHLDES
ncbi:hypothetical protein IW152_001017 [Coemansia sp. BCRC 34962]|nr:hypothetical protein IW152_001017 [Coemansia sp. BCRC 34962]